MSCLHELDDYRTINGNASVHLQTVNLSEVERETSGSEFYSSTSRIEPSMDVSENGLLVS
jgi:hypothetical protein